MTQINFKQVITVFVVFIFSLIVAGCSSSAKTQFWGKTQPPKANVMRYVTGPEPESLDPHIPSGQPEARIFMALYDGLVEYDPRDQQPIPAIAESWETAPNLDEFIFHLRKNAKWSDGKPINANDFVYSFRRGFRPETLSRTASLGYFITYSEAFNGKQYFLQKDGKFVLMNDVAAEPHEAKPIEPFGAETEFRKFIKSPERVTLPNDPLKRSQAVEANPKLKEIFKFTAADLKNAPTLTAKIKSSGDDLTKFLAANLPPAALTCAENCTEAQKQSLADGLNKLLDTESLFAQAWFANFAAPENSKALADALAAENNKRAAANATIDEEIAGLDDDAKKAEKEKLKKKQIGKLFAANRFLLEETFPDEIVPTPLVLVKGEDIGIEAVDEFTVRITLRQSAPFFVGLLAHQFFRLVPEQSVEKHGRSWTRPQNIVTCGAFKLKTFKPYDVLILEKDLNYWDAENVKLDGMEFVAVEDQFTRLNLYKSGEVDAILNHSVPSSWIDEIKQFEDEYLNFPENATSYYSFNVRKPPFDNPKIRKAFSQALDRQTLSDSRKVTKPLFYYTPTGIFPDYDKTMEKIGEEVRAEKKITPDEWAKRNDFDPENARQLLTEAGFPVEKSGSGFSCPSFPADKVALTFNTNESNRQIAEFVQAQWKQNLGVQIPLKNMEFKTFLPMRNALLYDGMAQSLWSGDFMDPYTFLGLHYGFPNDGGSGFQDDKYDKMLDDANSELDPQKRYDMMARAEYYLFDKMPAMPLTINATNWIKKPYVKGLYPNPGTLHPWKFVYIERDPAKWDKNVKNIMTEKDARVEEQLAKLKSTMSQTPVNTE